MTGIDIAILLLVTGGAVVGFLRGFVQEVFSLLALVAAILAIRYAHAPLSAQIEPWIGTQSGAAVLAFALLFFVPYLIVRLLARKFGAASRGSILGPFDRVLGLGFGVVKVALGIVIAFSIVMLGYDMIWTEAERPEWVVKSRTYPFVNAASNELVTMLARYHHGVVPPPPPAAT